MKKENNIFDHLAPRKVDVPDASYFEHLTKSVLAESKPKVIPLYRRPIAWIGAAAATISIILLSNLFIGDNGTMTDPLLALNECSTDEIAAYIEENIHAFDADLLEEYVPEDSLNIDPILLEESVHLQENDLSVSMDEIDKEDIINYFDEYEVDPYELEDEDIFI